MTLWQPGMDVTAERLNDTATVWNFQGDSYSLTTTTYGTAASAGTYVDCAVTFIAPASGRVKISLTARITNSAVAGVLVSTETRAGSVVGSGTVVEAAADAWGVSSYSGTLGRVGSMHMLSGLTPGSTYNVRALHKVASGTGSVALRELIVEPAT